ncbi:MAG TPA: hypothetical protein V6C81_18255 [Planktothrix sp.]|jgi:hypothetical protein
MHAYLFLPLVIALFFAIRWRMRQDRQDNATLNTSYDKLNAEVLSVSLLISKNCPTDSAAHTAVIEAAKCLVFPKVGPHTIVSASMIEARYQEGFAHLNEARKLAGGAQ